ncbi:MAG: hypothetical protein FK733_16200 [Asgard group archaeon]|nr:hypothetical protein [Asgard group archaeon]
MRIYTYNNYDPNWENTVKPIDIIKSNFGYMNEALKALKEIKPELTIGYIEAVKKRLLKDIKDYNFDTTIFDITELLHIFPILLKETNLLELIITFTVKYLRLTEDYTSDKESVKRLQLQIAQAQDVFSFHRTKAFVDLLGRDEGINLWKQLVDVFIEDRLNRPDSRKGTMKDFTEEMRAACSKTGGSDCIFVVFDNYRFLQKIDRCICHEGTKDLNDPEIAYLSYCYTDDVTDRRTKGVRRFRRRRSQTLYFKDFCDEFFWDDEKYPDADQPSLEFMKKLGKEDPSKLENEYS